MKRWIKSTVYPPVVNRNSNPSELLILEIGGHQAAHVVGNSHRGWTVSFRQGKPITLMPAQKFNSRELAKEFVSKIFSVPRDAPEVSYDYCRT